MKYGGMNAAYRFLMVAIAVACSASGPMAYADKADRRMPVEVEADNSNGDTANNVLVLTGNVVLTQGSMRIAAERMRLSRDANDNKFAELFGPPGGQISFREKRERASDYMEGVADRAEYDERTGTLKLFGRVKLKSGADEYTGDYVFYDANKEIIEANGRIPGDKSVERAGRVRIVIQPRSEDTKTNADAKK